MHICSLFSFFHAHLKCLDIPLSQSIGAVMSGCSSSMQNTIPFLQIFEIHQKNVVALSVTICSGNPYAENNLFNLVIVACEVICDMQKTLTTWNKHPLQS